MSNKPELNWNGIGWKDAPKWAKYRQYDSNGVWYWYEEKPHNGRWEARVSGFGDEYEEGGNCNRTIENWRDTLEMRPAKKPQTLQIAKLIGAAASGGLLDVEDMPDDMSAALAYFVEINDTAAQMADYYNRVERATMAIIESLEAAQ